MTQCEAILKHIEEFGSITDEEARNLKIHRLASRIYDLRRQGHNIISEPITGKNEYGSWRCARYKKAV
jgi:hypothetical protein